MRRSPLRQTALGAAACLTLAATAACSATVDPASGAESDGPRQFPAGATFDYQLGGGYAPSPEVDLVVRDRTASPAQGLYSVCYLNAFQTQPGEGEQWPNGTLLTLHGKPVVDPDWPDEVLLDTSTNSKRKAIVGRVSSWIQGCADDGFDAVEFDNLDSFTRSHDALTFDDNLALATDLAAAAHQAGLSVGQKNSAEYTGRLKSEAGFDFAVAEECAAYDECPEYTKVYGDAVIDIEYTDELPRSFTTMCEDPASPTSMILRDRDLVTPEDEGYVFRTCSR